MLSLSLALDACAKRPPEARPVPSASAVTPAPMPTPAPTVDTAPPPEGWTGNQQQFIARMAALHGFAPAALDALFREADYREDIIRLMTRPAEAKPWHAYRKIFITEQRISGGRAFLREHADALARAEREYGVPPEIITAIIGVETRYGAITGKHRVFDALSTLAFGYPKRAPFFTSEMEHYLLLTRDERLDPLALKGSYAGAMGIPQFMPSSYRRYGVDFDGNGQRDLLGSPTDAIGSVARYFQAHGWQRGGAVTVPARVNGTAPDGLVDEKLVKPHRRVNELTARGVQPSAPLAGNARTTFMKLDGETGAEYWIGLDNFYVITRYNHSARYAMAVHQLSQLIMGNE